MRQEIQRFLCSVREAAEALECHPKTYERWAKAGKVPMWVYVSGERRIVIKELEDFVAAKVAERDRPASKRPPTGRLWREIFEQSGAPLEIGPIAYLARSAALSRPIAPLSTYLSR